MGGGNSCPASTAIKFFLCYSDWAPFCQFLLGRRAAEREKQPPEFPPNQPAFPFPFAFPTLSWTFLPR